MAGAGAGDRQGGAQSPAKLRAVGSGPGGEDDEAAELEQGWREAAVGGQRDDRRAGGEDRGGGSAETLRARASERAQGEPEDAEHEGVGAAR
eukprot:750443-Hanusia_phi.AAC.9